MIIIKKWFNIVLRIAFGHLSDYLCDLCGPNGQRLSDRRWLILVDYKVVSNLGRLHHHYFYLLEQLQCELKSVDYNHINNNCHEIYMDTSIITKMDCIRTLRGTSSLIYNNNYTRKNISWLLFTFNGLGRHVGMRYWIS